MSRGYFPFDMHSISTAQAVVHKTTESPAPRSPNPSTGIDSSAFGSGSSVLSTFEPPTDAELDKTTFSHLLDDNALFTGSLEDLRLLIAKLQAIYFYRQGLRGLADETMMQSGGSFADMNASSLVANGVSMTPTSIPGSAGSIWKMEDPQLSAAARAVEAAATEMSTVQDQTAMLLTNSQIPGQQQFGLNDLAAVSPNKENRRRSRRQQSCPVALAPQWADATWNPRRTVKIRTQSTRHGTGVFLPPQLAQITHDDGAFDDFATHIQS